MEEKLRALLRDLDALKQRPDPASVDRMQDRVVGMMTPASAAATRTKIRVAGHEHGGGGQQSLQQAHGAAADGCR